MLAQAYSNVHRKLSSSFSVSLFHYIIISILYARATSSLCYRFILAFGALHSRTPETRYV